jgi:hypothetical protein
MYVLGGRIRDNDVDDGDDDDDVDDDDDLLKTASVLKFDSAQGGWSLVAPMPELRWDFAACAVGKDIFVFGGSGALHAQSSVIKYNTEADTWSTMAPMPCAAYGHSACVLNGLIYIMGTGVDNMVVLRFDPLSGAWSTLAPTLNCHRYGASFVLDGCLYAAGGARNSASTVERYDAAADTWTAVASMLQGRTFFNAITIGSAGPAEEQDLFDSLIAKAARREP